MANVVTLGTLRNRKDDERDKRCEKPAQESEGGYERGYEEGYKNSRGKVPQAEDAEILFFEGTPFGVVEEEK